MRAYYDDDSRAGRGFTDGGMRHRGFSRRMAGAHERGRDGGMRRGGRRPDAETLGLLMLKLLADAPRHGHELIRALAERSGGTFVPAPGAVYPTLAMLADMALIDVQPSDDGGRRYAPTDAGTAYLAERADAADAILRRLTGERPDTRRHVPVRRAMANLRAVLHDRLGRGDIDEATLHEAVAAIDAVAQRIERL